LALPGGTNNEVNCDLYSPGAAERLQALADAFK
jgi:hypothetical protein